MLIVCIAFAQQFRVLDDSSKWEEYEDMIYGATEIVPFGRHFPSVLYIAPALPLRVVQCFNPTLANYLRLIDVSV